MANVLAASQHGGDGIADSASISRGCIQQIRHGALEDTHFKPTMQILKVVEQEDGRSGLILSDGEEYVKVLLAASAEQQLPKPGTLPLRSQIKLLRWQLTQGGPFNQDLLLVKDFSIMGAAASLGSSLGEPEFPPVQGLRPSAASHSVGTGAFNAANFRGQMCSTSFADRRLPRAVSEACTKSSVDTGLPLGFSEAPPTTPIQHVGGSNDLRRRRSTTPQPEVPARATLCTPVAELSPYLKGWRIRVRVLSRSEVREFSNAKGKSQRMSCELMDRSKSEIRATFFGRAVDKFYSLLEPMALVELSGGTVKLGHPKFTSQGLEITFDERLGTLTAFEDDGTFPAIQYKFQPLSTLSSLAAGSTVDVAGVIVSVADAGMVATKRGQILKKDVTLVDMSGSSCLLALWGAQSRADIDVDTVAFVRHARISDYAGCSLSLTDSGSVVTNPPDHRAYTIQRWYSGAKTQLTCKSSTSAFPTRTSRGEQKLLSACKREDQRLLFPSSELGTVPSVHTHRIFPVTVTEIFCDRQPFYLACPELLPGEHGRGRRCCNKKAEMLGYGQAYGCAAGHITSHPIARYMLRLRIADASGQIVVTAFDDEAGALLGVPAADFQRLWASRDMGHADDAARLALVIKEAQWRRLAMTLRSRRDTYSGLSKVQTTVTECTPVAHSSSAITMLASVLQALQ